MVKSLRKIKPLINQAELARRMHVTPAYVCLLFSGKRRSVARLQEIRQIIEKELGDGR